MSGYSGLLWTFFPLAFPQIVPKRQSDLVSQEWPLGISNLKVACYAQMDWRDALLFPLRCSLTFSCKVCR